MKAKTKNKIIKALRFVVLGMSFVLLAPFAAVTVAGYAMAEGALEFLDKHEIKKDGTDN